MHRNRLRLESASRPSRRAPPGALSGAATGLATPRIAHAQAWPARLITLIVGFPPGGLTDIGARLVQAGLSRALDQTVVIGTGRGVPAV